MFVESQLGATGTQQSIKKVIDLETNNKLQKQTTKITCHQKYIYPIYLAHLGSDKGPKGIPKEANMYAKRDTN